MRNRSAWWVERFRNESAVDRASPTKRVARCAAAFDRPTLARSRVRSQEQEGAIAGHRGKDSQRAIERVATGV
ncbi:hypothetical protein [Lysobacter gummosus]|uniref:hypothetical protein n=1 Tax=Lysobacter gummosus TaxID=262324 RepID=UPI00363CAB31